MYQYRNFNKTVTEIPQTNYILEKEKPFFDPIGNAHIFRVIMPKNKIRKLEKITNDMRHEIRHFCMLWMSQKRLKNVRKIIHVFKKTRHSLGCVSH